MGRNALSTEVEVAKGYPVIDRNRCKGCGLCIDACPKNILDYSEDTNANGVRYSTCIDEEACIACSMCATMCPDTCIQIYKVR